MLMHHGDALGQRVRRPRWLERRAAKPHRAAIGPMHAEDQVAQGRFAGAVLAEDAVNFAGTKIERDVRQRREAAEPLADRLSDSNGSTVATVPDVIPMTN